MKKKALISSILTIALCLSLIAGSTFALFTSESKVNVAVSAGNVDVVATLGGLRTWSFDAEQPEGRFENDGSAEINGAELILERMTPGDKAELVLQIDNNSNVNIQYRIVMKASGALAPALIARATIEGVEYDMTDGSTVWRSVAAEDDIADVTVTVEFPGDKDDISFGDENSDNIYMNESASISLTVEAVQGNAQTSDAEIDVNADNFASVLAELDSFSGSSVTLNMTENVEWATGGAHGSTPLVSASASVGEIVIRGNGNTLTATGDGVGSLRAANGATLIFKDVNFVDESVSYAEDSWEFTYLELAGKLVFEGCTFNSGIALQSEDGETTLDARFVGCSFISEAESEYSVWVSDGKAAFFECSFSGTRGAKIHEAYGSEVESVSFEACEFGPLSKKPGVAIGTVNADTAISIKNSTFEATQAGEQGNFKYESDTDLDSFSFVDLNNAAIAKASDIATLSDALADGKTVTLTADINEAAAASSGYGATGLKMTGGVLDGNGKVFNVTGANGTWDSAINALGGTVKDLTVSGAFRGIFMSGATADLYIDNVVFDNVVYTFNSDGGSKDYSVTVTNSTLNGWTSFSNVHKSVSFENCKFGEGSGYAFCRPYQAVTFSNCEFEAGYTVDISQTQGIVFDNCTVGGVLLSADNIEELVGSGNEALVAANVTVK